MIFYRACSLEEFNATNDKLNFKNRFMFITPNEEFIHNRVLDGEFNNSKFKSRRYTHILEIDIPDISRLRKLNHNEYMIDRRCNVKHKIVNKYEVVK